MSLNEDQSFFALTLICGVGSGFIAVFIHWALHSLTHFLRPEGSFGLKAFLIGLVFVAISGFITTRYQPTTGGSGIPYIRLWLVARNGYISFSHWITKLAVTLLSLSSGMSLGREGPTVAITAGFGSSLATVFHMSKKHTKALVAIGSAGGLAAAFNTPMAAVIFTLEEIVGDLNYQKMLGQIIISSVIASFISSIMLGPHAAFTTFNYALKDPRQLFIFLFIGLVAGVIGPFWSRSVLFYRNWNQKIFKHHKLTIIIFSFMLVSIIGYLNPAVLGSGDDVVNDALLSLIFDGKVLIALFLLKFLATTISYGCGISGGLFMPTLFMGAMLGGTVAAVAKLAFPEIVGSTGAFALVGMGAFFASVIRAPFTSILMIFGMTHDYKIILPLMLANITAYVLAGKFSKKSIYEQLAEQDGMHLPENDDDILDTLLIEDVMVKDVKSFPEKMKIPEAIEVIKNCKDSITGYPVLRDKTLVGFVSIKEILNYERESNNPEEMTIGDICIRKLVYVYPDQSLLVAFHKIQKSHITRVLVVSRLNNLELLGIITAEDIVSKFGYHVTEEEERPEV